MYQEKIFNLFVECYKKGQRDGHKKAVEICKDALKGLESANSSRY